MDVSDNNVVASQRQPAGRIRQYGGGFRNDIRNGISGEGISSARPGNAIGENVLANGDGDCSGWH